MQRDRLLEREDVSVEEGERLVRSIHGLDRAINALEGLDEPSIGEQIRQQKLEGARELLALIRRS